MTDITNLIFTDESKAREHLESIRWPNGPFCPHCAEAENVTKLEGESHRAGLHQCNSCRGHFTVTNGTVMESSHVPLNKWVLAFHLMCASKKGIGALQLQRMLELGSYRTAWFMNHRIREAMTTGGMAPMGGAGKIVEVDETFIGNKKGIPKQRGYAHKHEVLTLVERGGKSRSFHVDGTSAKDVMPIIKANIAKEATVMTNSTRGLVKASLGTIVSSTVPVSMCVVLFIPTRSKAWGMKGIYQHCGEQHLHHYVAEFHFRYSNRVALGVDDTERTTLAIKGAVSLSAI